MEIIRNYSEAFRLGVADAGANLLRILILVQVYYNSHHGVEYPLQARIVHLIDRLNSLGHPGGAYYAALALFYSAIDTGDMVGENIASGLSIWYRACENFN